MPELTVNALTCTHCSLCVEICPWGMISIPEAGVPQLVEAAVERCILCGHCEAVCPTGALQLDDPQLAPTSYPPQPAVVESAQLGSYMRMRRSTRRYLEKPVERAIIEQLMDIVRYAPSGRNRQDVHWLIIHKAEELRCMTEMAIDWMRATADSSNPLAVRYNMAGMVKAWEEGRDYICLNAPHLVIPHVHEEYPVARMNAIIALAHLDIVAPSFGLGACWGGIFMQALSRWEPLQKAIDLPSGHVPVHCLMLGYPAIHYQRPPKRNPAAIVWR